MPWKLIERFEPCLGNTLACFVDGINQSESLGSVCFGSLHLHECARGNEVPTNLGVGRSYLLTVRLMIFSPLQFAQFWACPWKPYRRRALQSDSFPPLEVSYFEGVLANMPPRRP
jgi:hypothetical protein